MKSVVSQQIDNTLESSSSSLTSSSSSGLLNWIGSALKASSVASTEKVVLPLATDYSSFDFQPLDSLKKFETLGLKILIHFENNDKVVSNKHDEEVFELLRKYNPEDTVTSYGHGGGHNQISLLFYHQLREFRQKYGAAY